MRIIENVVLTYIADKMYSYLKEKNIEKLDKITENDILKKVKSLFMHQIGTFVINGTDNIIISRFLGLVTVGLYSNYYLIINSVNVIFSQFIQSTTASIGNLLVTEDCNKQFSIFKNLRFINLWISIFAGTSIFVIMDSFIQLWIGKEFILPIEVLLILTIVFYFNSTKATYKSFKEAAGIFYEDRYVPLVESLVNIVFSLIFVKLFGLVGVFIGTLISQMVLWLYSYPKYIYINLFKRNYYCYVKETIINFLTFVIIMVITYSISKIFVFDVVFLELIKNVICSIVIPNFILFILFFKCDEFKFLKHNIFHMFRKKA
jgi:O-antigen/teichoic acid export membrane protein